MTDTVVSSATREVVIGFGRPFVIIGERINPTGRKLLAAEMAGGDFSRVEADARAQVEAGAHMLDVNAGIPLADEPAILAKAVQLVQSITDVPLSIDSSIVAALEAGLSVYKGKALVNSVTGEEERLEAVLPLIKKYGAAVVAISNDETGISEDPDVRFAVARRIVERAADHGIPASDVVVDPLVMPIGAINLAGVQVMRLVRRLHDELKVNTTCGASNVSFGLPNRGGINSAFLTMAISSGLTSAITNPLHVETIAGLHGRGRHDGTRPALRALDRTIPRGAATGCRRRGRSRPPRAGPEAPCVAEPRPERRPMTARDPLVVFTPSGKRGRFPLGTPLLSTPRARSASTSIPSAAGAASAAVARCWWQRASSPSTACVPARRASRRSAKPSSATRNAAACHPVIASPARRPCRATWSWTCRRRARSTARSSARTPMRGRSSSNPVVRLHYVEVREPDMHDPSGDLRRLFEALEREWNLAGLGCDFAILGELQAALRTGEWKVTVAVHDASQVIALWPGFHDKALRPGGGRRLDHGGRTPVRPRAPASCWPPRA